MKLLERLRQSSPRARKITAGAILVLFLFLVFPFQITVAPTWRLQVVDDRGSSVAGINVTQHWQHNMLEVTAHEELRLTSSDGEVAFPTRTIRASLITRAFSAVRRLLKEGAGAKLNTYAAVVVWGSKDHETNVAVYQEGEPIPSRVVITRLLQSKDAAR